jgi:hypothetical protein
LRIGAAQDDIGRVVDDVHAGQLHGTVIRVVSAAVESVRGADVVGEVTARDVKSASEVGLKDTVVGKSGAGRLDR